LCSSIRHVTFLPALERRRLVQTEITHRGCRCSACGTSPTTTHRPRQLERGQRRNGASERSDCACTASTFTDHARWRARQQDPSLRCCRRCDQVWCFCVHSRVYVCTHMRGLDIANSHPWHCRLAGAELIACAPKPKAQNPKPNARSLA
jgi:hypothetical protein